MAGNRDEPVKQPDNLGVVKVNLEAHRNVS
jgi:hypothetical protein